MKKTFLFISFISVFAGLFFSGCYPKTYDVSQDLPVIAESDVAYLLDETFILTSDNFETYFYDYLSAPAALYISYENSCQYRCEDTSAAVAFADVISDAVLIDISYDEFSEIAYCYDPYGKATDPSIGFTNIIHSISFAFDADRTYIACFRNMTSPTCFMVEEDLFPDFIKVIDGVLPVCKLVTNPDELMQFE